MPLDAETSLAAASAIETEKDLQINGQPAQDRRSTLAGPALALRQALRMTAGQRLAYSVRGARNQRRTIDVTAGPDGRLTLVTDRGAKAVLCDSGATFGLQERSGPVDHFLDALALAIGRSPILPNDCSWRGASPTRLLPGSGLTGAVRRLAGALGCSLDSRYARSWSRCERVWRQVGDHRLPGLGRFGHLARTSATLCSVEGIRAFKLVAGQSVLVDARLESGGRRNAAG